MKLLRLLVISVAAAVVPQPPAAAAAADPAIPANCVAHTGFGGMADVPGDYRCAGLALDFHAAGVGHSPYPIWAGQWLFLDAAGASRVGTCTFNRGVHPSVLGPSVPVPQTFPQDPGGSKGAYLTWRYGRTTDDLTAAAMWAVFHFYAQDAAGSTRSADPQAPLVPTLGSIGERSGRADVQGLAERLDAEAKRLAAPWSLTLTTKPGRSSLSVRVAVAAGSGAPVAGVEVTVLGPGGAAEVVRSGPDGRAAVDVAVVDGEAAKLSASVEAPGGAMVFRGPPSSADPHGAQTLVADGPPVVIHADLVVEVPPTATTTTVPPETTTTTVAETTTTTLAETTTTIPETTTPVAETTRPVPGTTTTSTSATAPETTTTATATTVPQATSTSTVPATAGPPPSTLPRTGGGDRQVAYVGTSLLVAGIGLIGAVRRRSALTHGDEDLDPFWGEHW